MVVDYVLTVAVSLAAGAASLGSVFPSLAHHLLLVALVGLVLLTAVNMFGITESARLLMVPAGVFILSIFATIVVGALRSHPVATIGTRPMPIPATETLGILLILKAFAAGCSAVTGVEAISNGVPAFREAARPTAQRTEISLGVLLGADAGRAGAADPRPPRGPPRRGHGPGADDGRRVRHGLAVLRLEPRGRARAGLAANTSFGGFPVLMSLLAKDHRLPHAFYLRAEKPVYRIGIVALAIAAALLLVAVERQDQRA